MIDDIFPGFPGLPGACCGCMRVGMRRSCGRAGRAAGAGGRRIAAAAGERPAIDPGARRGAAHLLATHTTLVAPGLCNSNMSRY